MNVENITHNTSNSYMVDHDEMKGNSHLKTNY